MYKALWKSSVSILAKSNAELKKVGQKVPLKKKSNYFFSRQSDQEGNKSFIFLYNLNKLPQFCTRTEPFFQNVHNG